MIFLAKIFSHLPESLTLLENSNQSSTDDSTEESELKTSVAEWDGADLESPGYKPPNKGAAISSGDPQTIYTTLDCFKNGKRMAAISVNLLFCWWVCSLGYFGMSLGSAALPTNIFVTNLIYAAMDLPACQLCAFGMDWFGRRLLVAVGFLMGGVLIVLSTILNETTYCQQDTDSIFDNNIIMISFIAIQIGRTVFTAAFIGIYKYTVELYPVCIRANAVGICSLSSRIGAMVAPSIIYLSNYVSWLPGIVFGGFSILAGLGSFAYPETKGQPVMLTLQDARDFYKNK